MSRRDIRWKKVWVEIDHNPPEPFQKCVEFRVEVLYDGLLYIDNYLVDKQDFKSIPGIFGMTLDLMVNRMDKTLPPIQE